MTSFHTGMMNTAIYLRVLGFGLQSLFSVLLVYGVPAQNCLLSRKDVKYFEVFCITVWHGIIKQRPKKRVKNPKTEHNSGTHKKLYEKNEHLNPTI